MCLSDMHVRYADKIYMSGMYIEYARSNELKNSLGKEAKGCSGLSQKRQNGFQIGLQRPSESNVALQHPCGSQEEHFFLAGPPMEDTTDRPKIVSKSFQNDTKSKLHGICLMASIFVRFGVSAARL